MRDHDYEVEVVTTRQVRRRRKPVLAHLEAVPLTPRDKLLRAAWWIAKPRRATWLPVVLVVAASMYGTPHMLVTYRCNGSGPYAHCSSCSYFGAQGMRDLISPGQCPVIRLMPIDWPALRETISESWNS